LEGDGVASPRFLWLLGSLVSFPVAPWLKVFVTLLTSIAYCMGGGPLEVLVGDLVGWVGGLGLSSTSIRGGWEGLAAACSDFWSTLGDEGIKCLLGMGAETLDLELPSASTKFWRIALFCTISSAFSHSGASSSSLGWL
jgi:hypothetical protein